MKRVERDGYQKGLKRRRSRAKRKKDDCPCTQWVHRYSQWFTRGSGLPMLLNCTCKHHLWKYLVVVNFTAHPKDDCAGASA